MQWQDKQQNCDALAKMKFDCFISPSTRFLDIKVDITVVFLVSGTNVTGDVPVSYWPKRHLQDRVILLQLLPKSFSFFLSYLNLVIPARFKTTKALICTRKQNTEAFW